MRGIGSPCPSHLFYYYMNPQDMMSELSDSAEPAAPEVADKPKEGDYKVKFAAPAAFTPPQGVKPGDSFESMATFRMEDGGMLCLEAIDGEPLEGTEKEEAAESPEQEAKEGSDEGGGFLMAIEKGIGKKK